MKGSLKYKGYCGSIEVSQEDRCFHGKLLFIKDLVMYEGSGYDELEKAFVDAVDQYLEDCKTLGRKPNATCSGSFNVRIGAERHKDLAIYAQDNCKGINDAVITAVDLLLSARSMVSTVKAMHSIVSNTVTQASIYEPAYRSAGLVSFQASPTPAEPQLPAEHPFYYDQGGIA